MNWISLSLSKLMLIEILIADSELMNKMKMIIDELAFCWAVH